MSNAAFKMPTHVVDILGNVKGRDQPIMLINKASELVCLYPEELFLDPDVVFFDPFCKAGEILLSCVFMTAKYRAAQKKKVFSLESIQNDLYHSNRYFALAPDERHHKISLRTFLGNSNSHKQEFAHIIRNGDYLSEEDGTLNKEKFKTEFEAMINFIKETAGKKKIICVGNPPYQENYSGDGNNTGANPIYHLFLDAMMEHQEIDQFLMVIPSRWFAGGRGKSLKEFGNKLKNSKQIVQIHDFPNSREVFPTVEIKGGVCFLHWSRSHNGQAVFVNRETGEEEKIDLGGGGIIIRDKMSRLIMDKVSCKAKGYISDIAWSWNPFNLASNHFEKNLQDSTGELECFTKRMIIKKIKKSKISKNADKISCFKVSCPKAIKTGGVPHSPDQIFIMNKTQICTESYMVIDSFTTQKEAELFKKYLNTNLVRFLISIKKITQDVTKETWSLVPNMERGIEWNDDKLYKFFKLTKEEINFIESKVSEWE